MGKRAYASHDGAIACRGIDGPRASTVAEAALAFRPDLLGYFRQRTPSGEDAEDIAQDVFMRLLVCEPSQDIRFLRG